ncbi:hypothetical protein HDU85_003521 [Gaertneriomyces sp. JEL0708]|nr:hypothetical protein HDU85_003521 [Gaertneriomyces sp. JEL0708]
MSATLPITPLLWSQTLQTVGDKIAAAGGAAQVLDGLIPCSLLTSPHHWHFEDGDHNAQDVVEELLDKFRIRLSSDTVKAKAQFPVPSPPRPPKYYVPGQSLLAYLAGIQKYLLALGYAHIPPLFPPTKHSPYTTLHKHGKLITTHGVPIKCLEAVIVAAFLTCGIKPLVRILFVPSTAQIRIDISCW